MNWYDIARASTLKMAGRVGGAPHWKSPTFRNYIAPLIPNLQNYNPRKVRTLWEVGINLHQGLLKIKEEFLKQLKRIYDIAVGAAKGTIKPIAERAAQLAQAFLNSTGNNYGAKGKTGVGNLQAAFNAYVKPHLAQPMELNAWAAQTSNVGRVGNAKNPMDSMGYKGKLPARESVSNDLNFRAVVKKWNDFRKAIATDVRHLPDLGKLVAEASNRLMESPIQQQRQTWKKKDFYSQFVSPAMPEYFPDTPQGRTRFDNNIRPLPTDRPDMAAWKRENKFLLHDAWSHPPYKLPDGSLSGPIQRFLTNLKNRPKTKSFKVPGASQTNPPVPTGGAGRPAARPVSAPQPAPTFPGSPARPVAAFPSV